MVVDVRAELDLAGHHAAVRPLHHEVDLVVAVSRAQVVRAGFGCLGVDAHAQRLQRLEQQAEHRAAPGNRWARDRVVQQSGGVGSQQARRKCGVRQVVLGALRPGGASRCAPAATPGRGPAATAG